MKDPIPNPEPKMVRHYGHDQLVNQGNLMRLGASVSAMAGELCDLLMQIQGSHPEVFPKKYEHAEEKLKLVMNNLDAARNNCRALSETFKREELAIADIWRTFMMDQQPGGQN